MGVTHLQTDFLTILIATEKLSNQSNECTMSGLPWMCAGEATLQYLPTLPGGRNLVATLGIVRTRKRRHDGLLKEGEAALDLIILLIYHTSFTAVCPPHLSG